MFLGVGNAALSEGALRGLSDDAARGAVAFASMPVKAQYRTHS
jgi:hypothetical protein